MIHDAARRKGAPVLGARRAGEVGPFGRRADDEALAGGIDHAQIQANQLNADAPLGAAPPSDRTDPAPRP